MAARKEQEGEKNRFMLLLARRPSAYRFHLWNTEDITKTLNVFCAYSEFLWLVTVHSDPIVLAFGMAWILLCTFSFYVLIFESQINMESFFLCFQTWSASSYRKISTLTVNNIQDKDAIKILIPYITRQTLVCNTNFLNKYIY